MKKDQTLERGSQHQTDCCQEPFFEKELRELYLTFERFPRYSYDHRGFEQWLQEWLLSIAGSMKPVLVDRYQELLSVHVLPRIGKMQLTAIDSNCLRQVFEELAEELPAATVARIEVALDDCLTAALERKLIVNNPLATLLTDSMTAADKRAFTIEEQRRIEQAASLATDLPILTALYTGVESEELCGLKWSDIDWEQRVLHIQRRVKALPEAQPTKSDTLQELALASDSARRVIPLSERLHQLLLPKRPADSCDKASYIFTGKQGAALTPENLGERFATLKKTAAVSDLPFQALRYTFAVRCVQTGVSIPTISALLGHSSLKKTIAICQANRILNKR